MLIISFPTPLELDYIILQIPFKSQRNSPLERRIFLSKTAQKLLYYRSLPLRLFQSIFYLQANL